MNLDMLQEVLEEMGSSLVEMEAQNRALLQLLKNKGMVTEDEFAPRLAEAGKAANVRWRAAQLRLESQIKAEKDKEEREREKSQQEKAAKEAEEKAERDQAATAPFAGYAGQATDAATKIPQTKPDGNEPKRETSANENGGVAQGNAAPPKEAGAASQAGAGGPKAI